MYFLRWVQSSRWETRKKALNGQHKMAVIESNNLMLMHQTNCSLLF